MDYMEPLRLIERMLQEFKCERTLDGLKTTMVNFRHKWGKADEFLYEFNILSKLLHF